MHDPALRGKCNLECTLELFSDLKAGRSISQISLFLLAERARLTRAILALALRAVAKALRRPKSLPAILSNSRFGGEGEIRTREGCEALPVFKPHNSHGCRMVAPRLLMQYALIYRL